MSQILYLSIFLAVFAVFLFNKKNFSRKIQQLFLWFIIFTALFLGYEYFDKIKATRFFAELSPGSVISKNGNYIVRAARDGHFYLNLKINNKNIKFLVDTGATNIVLSKNDAKKLGFNIKNLEYKHLFYTANGAIYAARIILNQVELSSLVFRNVPVYVNQGDLDGSLLGLSFLRLFDSYKFHKNELILNY